MTKTALMGKSLAIRFSLRLLTMSSLPSIDFTTFTTAPVDLNSNGIQPTWPPEASRLRSDCVRPGGTGSEHHIVASSSCHAGIHSRDIYVNVKGESYNLMTRWRN